MRRDLGNRLGRALSGECRFEINGEFPERFINMCSRTGEPIYDVKRRNGRVFCSVPPSGYRRLLPIARKCRVRLRIRGKSGLPIFMLRYRRRSGMALGFCIFLGLLLVMSRFVWFVNVSPLSEETSVKLTETLDRLGVRPGVLRSRINAKTIEREIVLSDENIQWAGITLIGSKMTVEVKEMPKMPPRLDESRPCNIVASKSGIILNVLCTSGQAVVKSGQTVSEGEMLVSGVSSSPGGQIDLVHARAEVTALVEHDIIVTIPYTYPELTRTGESFTVHRLMFLGAEIPLFLGRVPCGSYERQTEIWHPEVLGLSLPIEKRTERWFRQQTVEITISPEYAEALARERAAAEIAALGDIEIVSQTENLTSGQNAVILEILVSAMENIAFEKEIFLNQPMDNEKFY